MRHDEYITTAVDNVSIHAPGRGATDTLTLAIKTIYKFQFTHPGGVRRLLTLLLLQVIDVSIHAPGRGATR